MTIHPPLSTKCSERTPIKADAVLLPSLKKKLPLISCLTFFICYLGASQQILGHSRVVKPHSANVYLCVLIHFRTEGHREFRKELRLESFPSYTDLSPSFHQTLKSPPCSFVRNHVPAQNNPISFEPLPPITFTGLDGIRRSDYY